MTTEFWRNKKVLVTGHTGFKGSWLCLWLQQVGADLCGLALAPETTPNLFELAHVADKMQHHIGDIRDLNTVKSLINTFQPEIIIHMAAQPLVRYSYDHPVETYATNVMGTAHVLEAVRYCDSVRVVVNITTDKCYENKEWLWGYRENEPMGGHDPYSNSKGCAELVTSAYRTSYFNTEKCGLASARAGNVIGGGDWSKDRLIPDIINSLVNNEEIVVRYPGATRPWQHVLEPLNGYLTLAEKLWSAPEKFSEAWNFGPDAQSAVPVIDVVKKMLACWKQPTQGWSIQSPKDMPHEANYLKLDISKATTQLQWLPALDIESTLTWVTDWYQAWLDNADMRDYSLKQIEDYCALIKN